MRILLWMWCAVAIIVGLAATGRFLNKKGGEP
jgi:hypothetical protein